MVSGRVELIPGPSLSGNIRLLFEELSPPRGSLFFVFLFELSLARELMSLRLLENRSQHLSSSLFHSGFGFEQVLQLLFLPTVLFLPESDPHQPPSLARVFLTGLVVASETFFSCPLRFHQFRSVLAFSSDLRP